MRSPSHGCPQPEPADRLLRRRDYADADLYTPAGRYGDVHWTAVALMVLGTVVGWGPVVNTSASWLKWQGYLLGPIGLGGKDGTWAFANLGVVIALVVAFVGWLLVGRASVAAQASDAGPPPMQATLGSVAEAGARASAGRA